jgi:hypothetical protein
MVYCETCQVEVKHFKGHCETYTHKSGSINTIPIFRWCKTCDKELFGKDSHRKSFCNQSCSASYNNKKFKKKTLMKIFCITCNEEIKRYTYKDEKRRKYCSDICNPQKINWEKVTYGEAICLRSYQKHSRIRDLARNIFMKTNIPKECIVCGYSRHIEICHYKEIKDHSDETFISDINKIENLIPLCRNHHWELDKLKDENVIKKVEEHISNIKNLVKTEDQVLNN